jgi:hypothetical protein
MSSLDKPTLKMTRASYFGDWFEQLGPAWLVPVRGVLRRSAPRETGLLFRAERSFRLVDGPPWSTEGSGVVERIDPDFRLRGVVG